MGSDARVMDIDRDGIVRIGERIGVAQHDFRRLGAELHTQLGHLRSGWQGEGGTAFNNMFEDVRRDYPTVDWIAHARALSF